MAEENEKRRRQVAMPPGMTDKSKMITIMLLNEAVRICLLELVGAQGTDQTAAFKKRLMNDIKNSFSTGLGMDEEAAAMRLTVDLLDNTIIFDDGRDEGDATA